MPTPALHACSPWKTDTTAPCTRGTLLVDLLKINFKKPSLTKTLVKHACQPVLNPSASSRPPEAKPRGLAPHRDPPGGSHPLPIQWLSAHSAWAPGNPTAPPLQGEEMEASLESTLQAGHGAQNITLQRRYRRAEE